MLRRHSDLFLSIFIVNDLVINSASWIGAYYFRFYSGLIPLHSPEIPPADQYLLLLIPLSLIWWLVFRRNLLYEPRRGRSLVSEFLAVFRSVTFGIIILNGLVFYYRSFSFSRVMMLTFYILNITLLAVSRVFLRQFLKEIRKKGYNQRAMLIIGAGETGGAVNQKIRDLPGMGYRVIGYLDDNPKLAGREIGESRVIGSLADLKKLISESNIDEIVITLPLSAHEKIVEVIRLAKKEGVRLQIVPDLFEVITHQASIDDLDGIPLIGLSSSPLERLENRYLKRGEDIVISLISLVIFGPIMLMAAALVKLSSRGPVLFRQERVGLDHRPFNVLKFRTMKVDAEATTGPVWASKDDDRCTTLGAYLRKTSLDELPQLFNVLKGDMSLVGPRPERPHFVNQFKEEIEDYMQRHHVKTGITGWAQVNGWRGNTSIRKRIEYDNYYIQNWSPALDIKILWLTIWKGFRNKHAY
ncbi:MAG: undecaprenyl-phosphate glucose phosphotransferase [bacterium]